MKKISCIVLSILLVIVSTFVSLSATRGDVNSDGKINATDALCILQYSVGYIFLDFNTNIADINMDGKVNSTDALVVLKITVGAIQPSTITTTAVYEPSYTSILPPVTRPEVIVSTTSRQPMTTIQHNTATTTTTTTTSILPIVPQPEVIVSTTSRQPMTTIQYNTTTTTTSKTEDKPSLTNKTTTATQTYGEGVYKIKPPSGGSVNLRSEPGVGGTIVATIKDGAIVYVDQISDGWGHTTYNGKEGWLNLKYAEKN